MRRIWVLLLAPMLAAAAFRTPDAIVAAAPLSAWQTIDPADLVLLDLAGGRTVTLQLAPDFAPAHVANLRALIAGGWFDGAAVERVQDNYVVQFGRDKGARPAGVAAHPPAEYERDAPGLRITPLASRDAYAPAVGFAEGWPVGRDPRTHRVWLAHCYGMVGVARDLPPDTGDGSELYAVIGQAPRQLDRNIALVGRILGGMTALDTLPRGHGPLGFYVASEPRTTILRARLAAGLPAALRPVWQVMRTGGPDFAALAAARANRRDAFFVRPAGGTALCNVPVPQRRLRSP